MQILKGLAGFFTALIFGALVLFIIASLSVAEIYAGLWIRILLVISVLAGGFLAGWGPDNKRLSVGVRLGLIISLLAALSIFWFTPQLWNSVGILKMTVGTLVLSLFSAYLSSDLYLVSHPKTGEE